MTLKKGFKIVTSILVTAASIFTVNPIRANAEWYNSARYGKYSYWFYWDEDQNKDVTGWKEIDGKWYFFYSDGILATNNWVDGGYYVNSNGEWTETSKYTRKNLMTDYIAVGESGEKYGQAGDESSGTSWKSSYNEPCLYCVDLDGRYEEGVGIGLNTLNIYYKDKIIDKAVVLH